MKISYKKLWVMLIEREIPKAVFRKETELSPGTMSKLNKNEDWGQGEGTTTTLTQGNGLLIGSAQWRALYGNDAVIIYVLMKRL